MQGIDTTIVEHRLPLVPNAISVHQQLRRMKSEVALKIKEEVEKQWNAGFLAVAEYPQWVANIVDLNRASPKDNFPLPHIDMLVDNMAQQAFYSFMDSFSGYNQIRMAEEDRKKSPSSPRGEHSATKSYPSSSRMLGRHIRGPW
ncbi:Retrovirus-related Pol polyprotein from transposon gypsy, partial [Mucuna pruriens]